MVHGKCVCGSEGYFAVFEVKGGYAVVFDDEKQQIRLQNFWAYIAKYEMVADSSLLSEAFVKKMSEKLTATPEQDTYDMRRNDYDKENRKFLEGIQDELMSLSRSKKKPVCI